MSSRCEVKCLPLLNIKITLCLLPHVLSPSFWWTMILVGASGAGILITPLFFAIVMLDLCRWDCVSFTFKSFTVKGKEFLMLFAVMALVIWANTVVGYVFFWNRHDGIEQICSTLFQCAYSCKLRYNRILLHSHSLH